MCSSVKQEPCMTLWLMKLFQSFLHYLFKCMPVNQTQSVFVLINENLTFERRYCVLPAAVLFAVLSVLNHIGTACAAGAMSQSLTKLDDGERQQLFRG